jgi:arylsulfatase A-like enzyme
MKTRFIWAFLLSLIILANCSQHGSTNKPNVIFILVDDLGWNDVGFMGSIYYETPNLDKLAGRSMVFTNAYAACAVCSPTRASIMTGKYPSRVGITDWIRPSYWRDTSNIVDGYTGDSTRKLRCPANPYWLELEEVTIAEMLKSAGYRTGYIGKWHLGDEGYYPEDQGFDINIGGCDIGQPPSYFDPYTNQLLPQGIHNLGHLDSGQYLTERLSDEAVNFIRAQEKQPFFLFLSHYAVHTPIQAEKRWIDYFQSKETAGGQNNPVYAAMIRSVDESIGEIVGVLDELGLNDNTVIFFFSDNGGHTHYTSNTPLRSGKGTPYEGGIREPLLVSWPGSIAEQSICRTPVSSIDFFPTLCQIAGVTIADSIIIDGLDISPLLLNTGQISERALYWHFPHYRDYLSVTPYSIIRKGKMKLITYWEGQQELYDLGKDISEETNLLTEFPGMAKALNMELEQWLNRTGARLPGSNPAYSDAD